ncbi:MAG TPA: acetamidase/formamidase family protein [Thermoplasmata archaeon]|nr:acetamidase/formamidase family protein [Thermoplasmata archaeon]
MRKLSSKKAIYTFTRKNKPAYKVEQGERVVVETGDCFSGLIRSSKTVLEDIEMSSVNPATGPIEVEGMRSGDTLKISIERIKVGSRGIVLCSPSLGIIGSNVRRSRTKMIEIKGNKARWSDDLTIDIRPHVGVIGVSPARGEYPTFHPGDFGGNMDTVDVRAGAAVYLPTYVDGAMLAMGDLHASMGDGEVCGTGIEIPGEVTVTMSRASDMSIARPMIETDTEWICYAAAKTLDEAAKVATSDMVRFIMNTRGTDFEDAYMLSSVAADLKISQVVDPLMAARMSISKKYL